MTEEQRKFNELVEQILAEIEAHEEASVRSALGLLERVQTEVIGRIAKGGSEFTLSVQRQVLSAIEARIEDFRRELNSTLDRDLSKAFDLGNKLVDEPVRIITQPLLNISREAVQVMTRYTASLVTGLSDALRAGVDETLQRAALGSLSVQEAIDDVGRTLSDPGPFRSIAARAETIVRTEVLRIQSIATQARMKAQSVEVEKAGWHLFKSWLTAGDVRVRETHRQAGKDYMEDGNPGPIGVDEYFVVDGEELLYPRDPGGSAKNTILCRCVGRPVLIKRVYKLDRDKKFER